MFGSDGHRVMFRVQPRRFWRIVSKNDDFLLHRDLGELDVRGGILSRGPSPSEHARCLALYWMSNIGDNEANRSVEE